MSKEAPQRPPPPRPEPPTTLEGGATPQQQFENAYQEAYLLIDRGITLITEGHNAQAGVLLQKGLSVIDKALTIKVESFDCSAEKTQQYIEMQTKMRCTRKEVLEHFSDTQASSGGSSSRQQVEDAPPSYDDYLKSLESETSGSNTSVAAAMAGTSSNPSYPDLSSDVEMMNSSPLVTPVVAAQQGEMIFNVENGVQIFFILPDGTVTSPSYPSFLAIFTFPEPIKGVPGAGANARGFLQVGEWSYPLVPAQSPVLHSFYGAYMFPNFSSSVAGSSVGVILPDSVDKDNRDLFEQILTQLTSYQEQAAPPGEEGARQVRLIQDSTSERIAAGAEAVSKGVVWGAGKLSELISYGSESLKDYVQPVAEKKEVDPKWHKTAEVARDISGKAVKVSGYLLSQVGKATMALGRKVAPHLQKQGTRAITHITGQKESEASSNVEGVLEVAAGAVKGASTIYMGLESAAATLAASLTDNTVKVVTHKYGEEVGALTDNTLYAVGQTAWAGHNIASLGVKGVAKRVAKDTGKALVLQHEEKKASAGGVEVAEEAMEDDENDEKDDTEEHPVRPVREKKKPPL